VLVSLSKLISLNYLAPLSALLLEIAGSPHYLQVCPPLVSCFQNNLIIPLFPCGSVPDLTDTSLPPVFVPIRRAACDQAKPNILNDSETLGSILNICIFARNLAAQFSGVDLISRLQAARMVCLCVGRCALEIRRFMLSWGFTFELKTSLISIESSIIR
jgi:hypothetical protein